MFIKCMLCVRNRLEKNQGIEHLISHACCCVPEGFLLAAPSTTGARSAESDLRAVDKPHTAQSKKKARSMHDPVHSVRVVQRRWRLF
jgi:hypothetical protein